MEVPAVVKLQAGERVFLISRSLLLGTRSRFFTALLDDVHLTPVKTQDGNYFIDRDPDDFANIVKVIRNPRAVFEMNLTVHLLNELEYFQLSDSILGPSCILLTGETVDKECPVHSYAYFPALNRYAKLPKADCCLSYTECINTPRGLLAFARLEEATFRWGFYMYKPSGSISIVTIPEELSFASVGHVCVATTHGGRHVYIPNMLMGTRKVMKQWAVETNTWSSFSMPPGVDEIDAVASCDNVLYILTPSRTIWKCTTSDHICTKLPFSISAEPGLVLDALAAGEYLYVTTGDNKVTAINTRTLKLREVKSPGHETLDKTFDEAMVACDGRLFLFGGADADEKPVRDALYYNGFTSHTISPLPKAAAKMAAWAIPTSQLLAEIYPSFD